MEKYKEKSRSDLHAGHRNRLRQRARKESLINFTEHQVLEYLLSFVIARKDTNDLAHKLINKFGSLRNVINTPYDVLKDFTDLGDASATFLSSLVEISNYIAQINLATRKTITCTADVLDVLRPYFCGIEKERLIIVLLDGVDKVVHCASTKMGSSKSVDIENAYIRELITTYNASKIFLGHNHPNGKVNPSTDDVKFTKALYNMMFFMGVELVDHCIMTPDGEHYSFRSGGLIDRFRADLAEFMYND